MDESTITHVLLPCQTQMDSAAVDMLITSWEGIHDGMSYFIYSTCFVVVACRQSLQWQKLLGEVQGLHDFVEAQKTIMDKPNLEKLMQAHVDQISARSSVSCSAEDAKLFTSLVSKGPWTEAQKQRLAEWCSKMLLESSPTARKGNSRRPGQVATSFAQYFSGKDVDILGSDATLALKGGLHHHTHEEGRPAFAHRTELETNHASSPGRRHGCGQREESSGSHQRLEGGPAQEEGPC